MGQFSVMFKYCPGVQHSNADGLSRQCGQCLRPGCPVSSAAVHVGNADSSSELLDQPFASSVLGDSMDADLLPEVSGETWVAATYLEEVIDDLPTDESEPDLIDIRLDETLGIVCEWVRAGSAPS